MHIAILSKNARLYSTQSLFQAAQRSGHRVRVMDHTRFDIVIKDGKPDLLYLGDELPYIDAIIPRIGASVSYFGTAVVRQFEKMNVFTTVNADAIQKSRDKLACLQLLSNAGLTIPKTVFSYDNLDSQYLIDLLGGAPLVIKLLSGTHGTGVVLAESAVAARSMIESFASLKQPFLLQEYIKEAKGCDLRAFVVDGKVVASMRRQAQEGEFRSNLHRGGQSEIIQLTPEEEAMAIKATEILGLKVAGVDMLQSNQGTMILEVNPSPGLEGIERTTQVDIAGEVIAFAERSISNQSPSDQKDPMQHL